jgi:hypothetical protein
LLELQPLVEMVLVIQLTLQHESAVAVLLLEQQQW